jgi:hypothetical protein
VSDTFTPPVTETPVKIPEYKFSLQNTRFPLGLPSDVEKHFGKKCAGRPHMSYIGNNPSACRNRYGLGYTINQRFGNQGIYTEYSNHVWLNQTNEIDGERLLICFDCGSLFINDKFIPYTSLENNKK